MVLLALNGSVVNFTQHLNSPGLGVLITVNSLEENIRPTFGGHEKFVFRHGWLKKGVDAVKKEPLAFTRDEALAELGVGKNMVRSIRHWCLATGLVYETDGPGLARPLRPTSLAEMLLSDQGWDPFLEDVGSLWLLHWQLSTGLTRGFVWHLLFSIYLEAEFTRPSMQKYITNQLEQRGIKTTDGAIEREIEYCLRTYIPAKTKLGAISEETLDCPLAELDIIRFVIDDNVYRFNVGPKMSLPLGVFGFGLLTFFLRTVENRRTVGIDEVIYHPGSPGQIFKLDENTVIEYLESLEDFTEGKVRLQETAGLMQVYLHEALGSDFQGQAMELLRRHYEQK